MTPTVTTPQTKNFPGGYVRVSFESNTKGHVDAVAYLPPGWVKSDTNTTYPLLIYLYGQGGTEFSFYRVAKADQLNRWINDSLIQPFVAICVRGDKIDFGKTWDKQKIQWYTKENEKLLTSEDEGELRHFCWHTLKAGGHPNRIALEGQSRGATGTLFYALKHSDKFSSFIANAYVSDYAIGTLKSNARRNQKKLQDADFNLRMEIGTKDWFVENYGRKGTYLMHDYLNTLSIPHEFDTLSGANHGFKYFWNQPRAGYENNGLFHLRFHDCIWRAYQDSMSGQRNLSSDTLDLGIRVP